MSLPDAVKAQLSLAEASQRVMQPFGEDDENVRVSQAAQEISLSSIARDDNPVVRLVNSMLFDALQSRASDIHVESTPQGLVIKYRIDGVLQQMGQASGMDMDRFPVHPRHDPTQMTTAESANPDRQGCAVCEPRSE